MILCAFLLPRSAQFIQAAMVVPDLIREYKSVNLYSYTHREQKGIQKLYLVLNPSAG